MFRIRDTVLSDCGTGVYHVRTICNIWIFQDVQNHRSAVWNRNRCDIICSGWICYDRVWGCSISPMCKRGDVSMTAPTTTRGRGHPRKQPENPECEVATKGYVKCVARKTTDLKHSHDVCNANQTENIGFLTAATAALTAFAWAICVKESAASMQTMFASIFWMSIIICAACSLDHDVIIQSEMVSDYIPDYLKKYEPPCEPKRGCEEQE